MRRGALPATLELDMYARSLEEASARLVELRQEEWGELGMGALALGAAVVASLLHPPLALPLFFGGLVVGALGIRALWRRWDLIDRLSIEAEGIRDSGRAGTRVGRRRSSGGSSSPRASSGC